VKIFISNSLHKLYLLSVSTSRIGW